jgi:hypothetical protein
MRLLQRALYAVFATVLLISMARAADRASKDEAKAMADKAAELLGKVGLDKAVVDFSNPSAGFIDRELFVNIIGPDRKLIYSYGVPVLVGRDISTLKDADGKEFDTEIFNLAMSKGSGWVDYRMTNPQTKKLEHKSSWVRRVGDYVVFVGAYQS